MAWILFIAAILIAFQLRRIRVRLQDAGQQRTTKYFFVDTLLEFFAILAIVASVYLVLIVGIFFGCEFASTPSLIAWEQSFRAVRDALGPLSNPRNVLFVLAGLLFLRFFGPPFFSSPQWQKAVGVWRNWIRRAYTLAVLLTSFTLLGAELGDPQAMLVLQITKNRDGYAQLRNALRRAAVRHVARNLIDRINTPPGPIAPLRDLQNRATDQWRATERAYERARDRNGTNLQPIRTALDRYQRATRTDEQEPQRRISEDDWQEEARIPNEEVAARGSHHDLEKARESASALDRPLDVQLLLEPSGRAVVVQMPKVITNGIKSELFSSLTREVPILGPVINIFTRTIDQVIERELQARIDTIANQTMEAPGTAEKNITDAGREIAGKLPTVTPTEDARTVYRIEVSIRAEITILRAASQAAEREAQRAIDLRVNRLIGKLTAPNEAAREEAMRELRNMAPDLQERHIRTLRGMLRDSAPRWRKYVSREGHCTWYEVTSPRYYAGQVLSEMESSYIDEATRSAARDAEVSGQSRERVTDPGWI